MANCPHCLAEYIPDPQQQFCSDCGKSLEESSTATDLVSGAGDPVETQTGTERTVPSPAPTGIERTMVVGEGNIVGDTVSIRHEIAVEFCASGAERIYEGRMTFRCPECQRAPVCERHFDEARKMCSTCIEGPTVSCSLCGERLPTDQTFTCSKCLRVAGIDHRDTRRNWCTDCNTQWAVVVESMDKGKVVITGEGAVVGKEEVELVNNTLMTKDGKPVATIKDTVWYAKPKQWFRVKLKMLRREQQAMRRFYPKMELSTTSEGDLCWDGPVTTWSENEYLIHLRYPDSFPHLPPKAFVVQPKVEKSRQIHDDGHLCLFHKDDKIWQPETTAATVMTWVSLWLHCYEAWQETGNWPRREHDQVVVTPSY